MKRFKFILTTLLLAVTESASACPPGSAFDTGVDGWQPTDTSCEIVHTGDHITVRDLDSDWVWIEAGPDYFGDWSACGSVTFDILGDTNSPILFPVQLELSGPAGNILYTFAVGDVVAGQWRTLIAPLERSAWSFTDDFSALLANVTSFRIRLDLTNAAANTPGDPLEIHGIDNIRVNGRPPCELNIAVGNAVSANFGRPIMIEGTTAFIGMPAAAPAAVGAVEVWEHSNFAWQKIDTLFASDGATDDLFGGSLAFRGDLAIIGAPLDDDNGNASGSAYIFRYNGTNWIEEKKLTAAADGDANDEFGHDVAIEGDLAIVGSWIDDTAIVSSGSVYVYRFDGLDWIEEQNLVSPTPLAGDRFGNAVAISDDVIVVAASDADDAGPNSGEVHIFRHNGSSWIWEDTLAPTSIQDAQFGYDLSMDGDRFIIGARFDDGVNPRTGTAYIYAWSGSSWDLQQKLTAFDGATDDVFGNMVSIYGDLALVGSPQDDDLGDNSGSAYLYRWDGSLWIMDQKINGSDGDAGDVFSDGGAINDQFAIIGSPLAGAFNSGTAYFFRFANSTIDVMPGESIQTAIDSACFGDEIVVHPGTYVETINFNGKHITVRSTDPTDSAVVTATIIDGNGAPHVVTFDSGELQDSVLAGFTITGGNANGVSFPDDSGGGVIAHSGSNPSIVSCRFTLNTAVHGGAMAGICARLSECDFFDNSSTQSGGALEIYNRCVSIERCTFRDNSSISGGAISATGLDITDCSFIANSATNGGAIYILFDKDDDGYAIDRCRFLDNDASGDGGGLYTRLTGPQGFIDQEISNCSFTGNSAGDDGGGAFTATGFGFAVLHMQWWNCTWSQNQAEGNWSALVVEGDAVLTNCIIWNDTIQLPSTSVITHSITDEPGKGNNTSDPLFIDANGLDDIPGTEDDDLRIQLDSPALNTGDNAVISAGSLDVVGNPRITNDVVDVGAYEVLAEVEPSVDQKEIEILHPEGGTDRAMVSVAKFLNILGGPAAQVSAAIYEPALHPTATGFATFNTTLDVQTSLTPGDFWLQPTMPFSQADLDAAGIADPLAFDLVEYDAKSTAWVLAGELNVDPLGIRYEITESTSPAPAPPVGLFDFGDYGVFWNPTLGKGYVWANLDHAGDFAVGYPDVPACPADIADSSSAMPDGTVNVFDLLELLANWGTNGNGANIAAPPNDTVDVFDLLDLLSAWGNC